MKLLKARVMNYKSIEDSGWDHQQRNLSSRENKTSIFA
jgi:hypothetical protein